MYSPGSKQALIEAYYFWWYESRVYYKYNTGIDILILLDIKPVCFVNLKKKTLNGQLNRSCFCYLKANIYKCCEIYSCMVIAK